MKKSLTMFYIMSAISLSTVQAQNVIRQLAIKDSLNFSKVLSRNIGAGLRASRADTACLRGQSFCKFRLDTNGQPVDISCDRLAPDYIKTALKSAIRQTSGMWIVQAKNDRPAKSKVIVQPFYYEINGGCKNGIYPSTHKNIQDASGLIEFEDGDYNLNDCIILPRITQLQAVK